MQSTDTEQHFTFNPEIMRRKTDRLRRKYAENVNVAIAPYMYLSDTVFDSLHTQTPTTESKRIFIHENRHIERQLAFPAGVTFWWLIYEHFSRFRLNEELIAIQAELLFFAFNNLNYPIKEKSVSLASPLYRNMIEPKDSEYIITKMWNEALAARRQRS